MHATTTRYFFFFFFFFQRWRDLSSMHIILLLLHSSSSSSSSSYTGGGEIQEAVEDLFNGCNLCFGTKHSQIRDKKKQIQWSSFQLGAHVVEIGHGCSLHRSSGSAASRQVNDGS